MRAAPLDRFCGVCSVGRHFSAKGSLEKVRTGGEPPGFMCVPRDIQMFIIMPMVKSDSNVIRTESAELSDWK